MIVVEVLRVITEIAGNVVEAEMVNQDKTSSRYYYKRWRKSLERSRSRERNRCRSCMMFRCRCSRDRSPYDKKRSRTRSKSNQKERKDYEKGNTTERSKNSKISGSANYLQRRSGSAGSRNSSGGSKSLQINAKHSGPCWNGCMCESNHCDFCASSKNSSKINFIEGPIMYPKQYQPPQYSNISSNNQPTAGNNDSESQWFTPHGKIISHSNIGINRSNINSQMSIVPGASDLSNSTPTLSSVSSKSDGSGTTLSGLTDLHSKSDGSGTTLSGLSDLQSPSENTKNQSKTGINSNEAESDTSDIEEVPVPPKPTPPLVELDE